jgi:hypothetical protein
MTRGAGKFQDQINGDARKVPEPVAGPGPISKTHD